MPLLDVAGLPADYEVAGEGDAVVLLHGGLSSADSWAAQQPALTAAGFRVWIPERRGHGHTPDIDGPFSYEAMAEETIAFLDALVGRTHLVGWSDGAVVGVLVALRRPDLVDRLVLMGQYFAGSRRVARRPRRTADPAARRSARSAARQLRRGVAGRAGALPRRLRENGGRPRIGMVCRHGESATGAGVSGTAAG